jgi:FkbM family methyltransferase
VGVGILTRAGEAFVDHAIADAARHDQAVELIAAYPDEMGSLVVRNASAHGSSLVVILNIDVTSLDESSDAPHPALLSTPIPMIRWSRYYALTALTTVERLRAARFQRLSASTLVRWSDGLVFEVQPGDSLSRVLYVSGTYEPNMLYVLRRLLRPGDVFLDVGGNAGIVTLAAAQWVGADGHVHVFEPSPREYGRLVDTIARNRLTNVSPHRIALGARRGTAFLKIASSKDGGLNTFGRYFSYADTTLERLEEVDVHPLDDVIAHERTGRIAAIKIDVEGMELHVLRGAREIVARDRPAIILEVFQRALESCGANAEAIEALLMTNGYRVWTIADDGGLHELNRLTDVDEQNVVALPAERKG